VLPRLRLPSVDGISFEGFLILEGAGITIGLISGMAHSVDPGSFHTNQWIQSILLWKTEDVEFGEYIDGETNFRAFCRTLTGDSSGFIRTTDFGSDSGSDFLQGLEEQFRMVFENCSDPSNPVLQKVNKCLRLNAHRAICCLKFARISSGYMALVPHASEVGDEICILLGSSTLMVLWRELCPSPTIEDSPANNSIHEEARAVH
jgi:hypothetical protein